MVEFKKFDPYRAASAFRQRAAKVAKVAKDERTLAALATLAALDGTALPYKGWTEASEERAAIIEYDARVPRDWAEGLATLENATPPAEISPSRWLQFLDDCGRFLDDGWAARAHALGWKPIDLLGCNPRRGVKFGRSGLVWLLDGAKLIALSANVAVVEASDGTRKKLGRLKVRSGGPSSWRQL